jgi:P-type E1-E2 ATPase
MLGVTGLQDLLQDDVAKCITSFRQAKIKVWMLTGDKGETAHNIGISCGLIDPMAHHVYKIKGSNKETL